MISEPVLSVTCQHFLVVPYLLLVRWPSSIMRFIISSIFILLLGFHFEASQAALGVGCQNINLPGTVPWLPNLRSVDDLNPGYTGVAFNSSLLSGTILLHTRHLPVVFFFSISPFRYFSKLRPSNPNIFFNLLVDMVTNSLLVPCIFDPINNATCVYLSSINSLFFGPFFELNIDIEYPGKFEVCEVLYHSHIQSRHSYRKHDNSFYFLFL